MKIAVFNFVVIPFYYTCTASPKGRSQYMLFSEDSAITSSMLAYIQLHTPLVKEGKIDTDPKLKERAK